MELPPPPFGTCKTKIQVKITEEINNNRIFNDIFIYIPKITLFVGV